MNLEIEEIRGKKNDNFGMWKYCHLYSCYVYYWKRTLYKQSCGGELINKLTVEDF